MDTAAVEREEPTALLDFLAEQSTDLFSADTEFETKNEPPSSAADDNKKDGAAKYLNGSILQLYHPFGSSPDLVTLSVQLESPTATEYTFRVFPTSDGHGGWMTVTALMLRTNVRFAIVNCIQMPGGEEPYPDIRLQRERKKVEDVVLSFSEEVSADGYGTVTVKPQSDDVEYTMGMPQVFRLVYGMMRPWGYTSRLPRIGDAHLPLSIAVEMYCEAERMTDGNDKTALAKLFRSAGLPISDEPLYTSSTLNADSWHALEPLGFITGDLLGAYLSGLLNNGFMYTSECAAKMLYPSFLVGFVADFHDLLFTAAYTYRLNALNSPTLPLISPSADLTRDNAVIAGYSMRAALIQAAAHDDGAGVFELGGAPAPAGGSARSARPARRVEPGASDGRARARRAAAGAAVAGRRRAT